MKTSSPNGQRGLALTIVMVLLCAPAFPARALVRSWTGNATGGNWSATANWSPASAPQSGDDLIFPAGLPAADLLSTNDLVSLRLGSITFNGGGGGYFLRGNSITISNGVNAAQTAGGNTINFDMVLGTNQFLRVTDPQATLTINGDFNLNGFTLRSEGGAGTNHLFGVISGTGRLWMSGRVVLGGTNGPNTFVGETRIFGGQLQLRRFVAAGVGGVSVPGDLFIQGDSEVIASAANQIADTATVSAGSGLAAAEGLLELSNVSDAIGALVFDGGRVRTGSGTLTNGNITCNGDATIDGNLHLGNATHTFNIAAGSILMLADIAGGPSAGITKTGPGGISLWGNNTYTGVTTVNDGPVWVYSATAFGGTQAGVVINDSPTVNPAQLLLSGVHIGNESLTINQPSIALACAGTNSWSGPIVLNTNAAFRQFAATDRLSLSNTISGPGGLTYTAGTFLLAGTNANTYTGTSTVSAVVLLGKTASLVAIAGPLVIGDNTGASKTDIVRLLGHDKIANSASIAINPTGLLDGNGFDDAIGPVTLNGGHLDSGPSPGTFFLNNVTATPGPVAPPSIAGQISLTGVFPAFNVTSNSAFEPDLDVVAQIVGSAGLIKNGPGQLSLNASNFYAGITVVNAGELIVSNSFGLGIAADGTRIFDTALLSLRNNSHVGLESLTFYGTGHTNLGALHSISGSNSWAGSVALSNDTVITVANNFLNLSGVVSGPGDLTKQGPGTLLFSGSSANTYAGITTVNAGELRLGKTLGVTAIPTTLIIGDDLGGAGADRVRLSQGQQIADAAAITLNGTAVLSVDGVSETVGPITFNGGDISILTGGVLTAGGNFTVNFNPVSLSRITGGQLAFNATRTINVTSNAFTSPELFIASSILGAGGIIKSGPGELELAVPNSYSGLTTINDGMLIIGDDFSLGATNIGTIVNGDAVLALSFNVHVGLEPLDLNSTARQPLGGQPDFGALFAQSGSNSWAGSINLLTNTTIAVAESPDDLALTGVIRGPGVLVKDGAGALILSGPLANTYTNLTHVEYGTLVLAKAGVAVPGDLSMGSFGDGALFAGVRLQAPNQIGDNSNVHQSRDNTLFDLNNFTETIGSLNGIGQVDLGTATLFVGQNNELSNHDGVISGSGGLTKRGTNLLVLHADNTYSGLSIVEAGLFRVNGHQPQSSIQVNPAGTLGGSGTVGAVNSLGGNVAPGTSPGILTSSNFVLNAASDYNIEIIGPDPGTGHDQLNVRGTVNLGGATLNVSVGPGFSPADGDTIIIIDNDGSDAVTGTFAGLPNGALLPSSGFAFRMNTAGGTGNDVALTVTNVAFQVAFEPTILTGNGNDALDPAECNQLRIPLINQLAGIVSGVRAVLSTTNTAVTITQPFSAFPDIPGGAIRSNTTPFQISTSAALVCGTNIDLVLTVVTATNGSFKVPFRMHVGTPAAPTRFNNDVDLPIADAGSVDSLINVAGFAGVVGRVTVSLHITHTADSDLDISLVGPDGTVVDLSSDNGGTFDDYGTSVADADRTLFIELAGVAIFDGAAPFRGAFRPEQPLSAFRGKFGSAANGAWRLRINDDTSGGTGTLRAWSLFLWPMACPPGGGECEQCRGPFIGSITGSDLGQPGRLFLEGNPSTCFTQAVGCPSQLTGAGTYRYDSYTFTNAGPASCVVVTLDTPCTVESNRLSSAAYLRPYNPANKCLNYLGDLGESPPVRTTYSFSVPSNAAFVVIVNEINPGGGCTNYTLHVNGFDCPQRLDIEAVPSNRVRLTWSTSAGAYQLTATNVLRNSPAFPPVNNEPFVINGKYTVTNNATGAARFYELRKP